MKFPARTNDPPNICSMFCQIHTCWIIASYYFVLGSKICSSFSLPWWLTATCHTPCCYEAEADIVANLLFEEKPFQKSNKFEVVLGKRLDHRRPAELELAVSPQFQQNFTFMVSTVIGAVRTIISISTIEAHECLQSSGFDEEDLGEGIRPSDFAIRVLWVSVLYFFLLGQWKTTSPFLVSFTLYWSTWNWINWFFYTYLHINRRCCLYIQYVLDIT